MPEPAVHELCADLMEGSRVQRRPARGLATPRVLEIPTPRWTAYDAKRFGVKLPPEVPVTQERAYTSPILVHARQVRGLAGSAAGANGAPACN